MTVEKERQVGGQRYNFFTGCTAGKSATIILRGGGEHFIDEAERSLHDAIMIVKRAMKHSDIVPGGGAIEMVCTCQVLAYCVSMVKLAECQLPSNAARVQSAEGASFGRSDYDICVWTTEYSDDA